MPNNIAIQGDDQAWKRSVDDEIRDLKQRIIALNNIIIGLQKRVK